MMLNTLINMGFCPIRVHAGSYLYDKSKHIINNIFQSSLDTMYKAKHLAS